MMNNIVRLLAPVLVLASAGAAGAGPVYTAGSAAIGDAPRAAANPSPSYPVDPSIFVGTGVDPTFHVEDINWAACAGCGWTAAQGVISVATDTEPVFIGRMMNDPGTVLNNCYNCINSMPSWPTVSAPTYDPTSVIPLVPAPSMELTPGYPYQVEVDVGNDD